jgi:hypothetical protein
VTLPRIVLVAGGRGRTAPTSWPHADRLVGAAGADGTWFGWRLLAANNRELGRSPRVHAAAADCLQAAAAMMADLDSLTTAVSADSARGLWRWRLDGAVGAVAVSSRLYLRQRECAYSLRQFLQAAPVAAGFDHPVPTVVDLTGEQPVLRFGYEPGASVYGLEALR